MHLRTRIALGILAAALVAFALLAYLSIIASKGVVRDRVDQRLLASVGSIAVDERWIRPQEEASIGEFAIVRVRGSEVLQFSGRDGVGDPPPRIEESTPSAGVVRYARSADGYLYRATTVRLADGDVVLVAAPVEDLSSLVGSLIRRLTLLSVGTAVLLAVVSFWWIRRTTRPIERISERAVEIAAGDADRELRVDTSSAELRRLSGSLQEMIESLDSALAASTASESRLRQFIADASHELRTPLTTIAGYLQLDVDEAFDSREAHAEAIGRASAEAGRMRRIIADLQLLVELDHDVPLHLTQVDVHAVAAAAVADAQAVDPNRTYDLGAVGPHVVLGDRDRLHQTIANLLSNVRRHTPAGSVALLSISESDGHVEIAVSDDGPGVSPEHETRLFDRFWRADPSRSRATGGAGLGLAIVASIVEAHHGSLSARRADTGGLRVTLRVPIAAHLPAETQSSTESPRPPVQTISVGEAGKA
jgi:two-component system, OmpR family, sensor kinase